MSDPRFTIHPPTVQGLPPTQPQPRKKLSHTVKARPSGRSGGRFAPIIQRVSLSASVYKRGRKGRRGK